MSPRCAGRGGRRGKGQHIGRRVLAAEAGVEIAHRRVVGQQHHDLALGLGARGGQGGARRGGGQGLGARQERGPAGVLDLDVDLDRRARSSARRGRFGVVGLDDPLHQRVADHVRGVEAGHRHALDAFQDADGVGQAAVGAD